MLIDDDEGRTATTREALVAMELSVHCVMCCGLRSAALATLRVRLGLYCIARPKQLECQLLSALESRIVREARAQSRIERSTASLSPERFPPALRRRARRWRRRDGIADLMDHHPRTLPRFPRIFQH